jgi:hypothetical protein
MLTARPHGSASGLAPQTTTKPSAPTAKPYLADDYSGMTTGCYRSQARQTLPQRVQDMSGEGGSNVNAPR